jgi:hypothetical protein
MKIIYEVSIASDIESKSIKEHIESILMDIRRGGIISDYEEKNWLGKIRRNSSEGTKKIIEKLKKENKIVFNGANLESNVESQWAEEVLNIGQKKGREISFAVVSRETSREKEMSKIKSPVELITNEKWKRLQEGYVSLRTSLEVYEDQIKKLVGPTKKVRIIDPFIDVRGASKELVKYIIKYTSKYLKIESEAEVNIHTSTKYMKKIRKKINKNGTEMNVKAYPVHDEMEKIKGRVTEAYENLEKDEEMRVKIWIWSHEESKEDDRFESLHDRYIVTDQFAVSVPWGFNIPEDERPPVTEWTRLGSERRDDLAEQFPRDQINYRNSRREREKFNASEESLEPLRDLSPLHELDTYEEFSLDPSLHETS